MCDRRPSPGMRGPGWRPAVVRTRPAPSRQGQPAQGDGQRHSVVSRLLMLVGVVLMATVVLPGRGGAHRAMLIGAEGLERRTAVQISDADIAWAVHGSLPAGATQHLMFMRPAGGMLRARVLVPTRQANLSLNPWLALVGPGLPRPADLDGMLAADEGAVLVAPPDSRELEVFQDLPWPVLAGAALELALPADGPYLLLVFDPNGRGGPYLLDIGYLQD